MELKVFLGFFLHLWQLASLSNLGSLRLDERKQGGSGPMAKSLWLPEMQKRHALIIIHLEHVANLTKSDWKGQWERSTTSLLKVQSGQNSAGQRPSSCSKITWENGSGQASILCCSDHLRPDLASGFRGKSPDAPSVGWTTSYSLGEHWTTSYRLGDQKDINK